jgi:tetratricopeptide (TPR) repeat protein
MGATDRFSRSEVQRILDVTEKQLDYWERLRIVSPKKGRGEKFYDFRDLIGLRTARQLISAGIPANRLRRALDALNQKLSRSETPLTELRIFSDGRDVIVEQGGTRLDPLSGQFVLNFETRELEDKVRIMPQRSADEWLAVARGFEADRDTWPDAIEAYERALQIDPTRVEAFINSGTLHYEHGDLAAAAECFLKAVNLQPTDALAQFNLGSILDESGRLEDARHHLRQAVSLNPDYSDAHYNLAFVCEKLGAFDEARRHWRRYVELDPASPWCEYARQRLGMNSAHA